MIPVATTKQMRECDRTVIEDFGLPGLVLMETASRAVAARALKMLGNIAGGETVWIFCGKGNNGGDGFAVARHLLNAGIETYVALMGKVAELKGDAKFNCEFYLRLGGEVFEKDEIEVLLEDEFEPDLVIDALLGTGFTGTMRDDYGVVVEAINSLPALVLAVDIPSGVEGDTGSVKGRAVYADCTVTFAMLKRGLVLPPGRECAGDVDIADIGIPPEVIADRNIRLFLVEESDVRDVIPRRMPTAHKGLAGHVYVLAGSPGLTGAAAMVADAAMKTGAGLAAVGVPHSLNQVLEIKLDEAMTQPLPETDAGCLSSKGLDAILEKIEWATVVAIGPGLGRDQDTAKLLVELLPQIKKPLVVDADGLNLLADNPGLIAKMHPGTILTPHPGEFARLTGQSTVSVIADPVGSTEKWARDWQAVVVLKGSPTIVAFPDGWLHLNPTGNPGMATGGSGDVLTGIIAGLIAQGVTHPEAAWSAVYLHGMAGDEAAKSRGIHGMVARDILERLPMVIQLLAASDRGPDQVTGHRY